MDEQNKLSDADKLVKEYWEKANLRREIEEDINKQARLAAARRFKDKPGHWAGLGYFGWLIIIAMCFFVGSLLAR